MRFVPRSQALERAWHNVLIYGPAKTGKTALACSAPGGILLANADTVNATRYVRRADTEGRIMEIDLSEGKISDIMAEIELAMAQSTRVADTVVIDPVGELHRRLLEQASNMALRAQIQQYGDTSIYLERFCRNLVALPCNVVLVCHELSVQDDVTETTERMPFTGTSGKGGVALANKLMGMVDIIAYAGVLEKKDEHDETQVALEYVCQLQPGKGRRGGDRFASLGGVRKSNLAEWFDAIAKHEAQSVAAAALEAAKEMPPIESEESKASNRAAARVSFEQQQIADAQAGKAARTKRRDVMADARALPTAEAVDAETKKIEKEIADDEAAEAAEPKEAVQA
jgi:hypothetical protein